MTMKISLQVDLQVMSGEWLTDDDRKGWLFN